MCTNCQIQINDLYQKIGKKNSEAEICRERGQEEDNDHNEEGKLYEEKSEEGEQPEGSPYFYFRFQKRYTHLIFSCSQLRRQNKNKI